MAKITIISPTFPASIGVYRYQAFNSDEGNWLVCDGRALSRTTYASLFTKISTAFGVGDGSTTFNLPNLAGRAIGCAGQGSGLTNRTVGASVGAETHTLATTEMPSHSHTIQGYVRNGYDANDIFSDFQGLDTGNSAYGTSTVGGGLAHNNIQPTDFFGYLAILVA